MSRTDSGSIAKVWGSELPRIVEETDGQKYALSGAWVMFEGEKFVLAFEIDSGGSAKPHDLWFTEEITGSDGAVSYNDIGMLRLLCDHQILVQERLEAILAGTAESGPLEIK